MVISDEDMIEAHKARKIEWATSRDLKDWIEFYGRDWHAEESKKHHLNWAKRELEHDKELVHESLTFNGYARGSAKQWYRQYTFTAINECPVYDVMPSITPNPWYWVVRKNKILVYVEVINVIDAWKYPAWYEFVLKPDVDKYTFIWDVRGRIIPLS